MHRFNFPRLAAVLVTAVVVFVACAQGPGTPEPRGPEQPSEATGPPDTAPSFADTVDHQTYTEGVGIVPLALPEASGGNGTLSYSLSPTVPGLTFVTATRTLSGTPTSVSGYDMTYRAADGDNNTAASDAATLSFTITVQPAATLYVGCSADAETWRGLRVCSERPRDGYDRDAFGTGYRTLEDDIIAALPPTMKANGQVYTPYSCIAFDITPSGTAATDIEHIVALAEAHDSGIDDDRRRDIASDLDNLTIADLTVNRSQKGAGTLPNGCRPTTAHGSRNG